MSAILCAVAMCVGMRLTGSVELDILVGAGGDLKNVSVIAGHPMLTAGAVEMARSWRFTPGSINGVPTEMKTHATLVFATGGADLPAAGLLPAYPKGARKGAVSGVVDMRAIVAPDGSVTSVEIVNGPELLRQAGAEAVRQWRFEPSAAAGATTIPVQIAFNYFSRPSICPLGPVVGALIPPHGPFPRLEPGVVPPHLR